MRPKFFIILLLAGVLGVAVIFALKPSRDHAAGKEVAIAQPPTPARLTNSAVHSTPVVPHTAPATSASTVVPLGAFPKVASPTNEAATAEEAFVHAQIERLEELQANYDPASLKAILTELTNTNPIIRQAAIEATIQFQDRAAIPVLEKLASLTTNPEEKQELVDAAEYLKLPTYTEVMRAKRAKTQGAGNP